jgi:hypothetical protein
MQTKRRMNLYVLPVLILKHLPMKLQPLSTGTYHIFESSSTEESSEKDADNIPMVSEPRKAGDPQLFGSFPCNLSAPLEPIPGYYLHEFPISQPVDGTLITYHNGLPSSGHAPFHDQNDDAPSDSQDTNMLKHDGKLREAPTQLQAIEALKQLGEILHPPRKSGRGYKDPGIDPFIRIHMEDAACRGC